MEPNPSDVVESEILRVRQLTREMLTQYVQWGPKIKYADAYLATFGDVIDFVNFRVETVNSCLDLLENNSVADALGLCRSLLENYLLLMLMCRGDKYFLVEDLSQLGPKEFGAALVERQEKWQGEKAAGKTQCVDVSKYPRAPRHVIYIFDGLILASGEKLPISRYFFQFEAFRPEVMRLDSDHYFEYYPKSQTLRTALKKHRAEAAQQYKHALSYDAMLYSLRLNKILDDASEARLEAHYTFLGKFLHPTKDAARGLRMRANWHDGQPGIGMSSPYKQSARLLAELYVANLAAGLLAEIAGLFDRAGSAYVSETGTAQLNTAIADSKGTLPYFWFLFNEAPPYDKWNWAVHHATDEQLRQWGGFQGVPSDLVEFNDQILGNLESGMSGWHNARVGAYDPKLLFNPKTESDTAQS